LLSTTYLVEVMNTADSSTDLRFTFDAVRASVEVGTVTLTYDSTEVSPQAGPLRVYAGLIGSSFELSVTPTGDITAINGLSEAFRTAIRRAGEDGLLPPETIAQAEGLLDPTVLRSSYAALFDYVPPRISDPRVRKWSREVSQSGTIRYRTTMHWRIANSGNDQVRVQGESAITEDSVTPLSGSVIRAANVSGSVKAGRAINTDWGWLESGTTNTRVGGTLELQERGGSIDFDSHTTVNILVIRL